MEASSPIRVLVVDDHALIREGVKAALQPYPDIACVGEAEDGGGLLALLGTVPCDVVLLDLNMPGVAGDPAGFARAFKKRQGAPRVLVLTGDRDFGLMMSMVRAGVEGYVLKEELLPTLVAAIREVATGSIWIPSQLAKDIMRYVSTMLHTEAEGSLLTPREAEVLALLAQEGGSPEAIAATLGIAVGTVRVHLKRIFQKLGVHSQVEAVRYVIHHQTGGEA